MKRYLLSWMLVSAALFTSCGDELGPYENKKFPTQLEFEDYSILFSYDQDGRMINMEKRNNNQEVENRYLHYADNGMPNKITIIKASSTEVETEIIQVNYTSDTQVVLTSDTGEVVQLTTDNEGKVLTKTTPEYSISYSYDSKGNNIQINRDEYNMSVVYGNTIGILSAVRTPQWVFTLFEDSYQLFTKNNPTSHTQVFTPSGVGSTVYTTYQYPTEFIQNGYPTRVIIQHSSNGVGGQSLMRITY